MRELKEETGYVGEVVGEGFGVSPVMFNGEYLCATRMEWQDSEGEGRCWGGNGRLNDPGNADRGVDDIQIPVSAIRTST